MSKNILVVDDDNLIRKSVVTLLKNAKHEIHEATDGQQGLDTALKLHPDIILTDVRMPNMTGLEMVEAIRRDEWGKTVPIIILTSDEATPTINEAIETGVTVYLSKNTVDPEALSDQILAAIGD